MHTFGSSSQAHPVAKGHIRVLEFRFSWIASLQCAICEFHLLGPDVSSHSQLIPADCAASVSLQLLCWPRSSLQSSQGLFRVISPITCHQWMIFAKQKLSLSLSLCPSLSISLCLSLSLSHLSLSLSHLSLSLSLQFMFDMSGGGLLQAGRYPHELSAHKLSVLRCGPISASAILADSLCA